MLLSFIKPRKKCLLVYLLKKPMWYAPMHNGAIWKDLFRCQFPRWFLENTIGITHYFSAWIWKMVWLKSHIILPEWLSLVILSHEPIVLWHVVWVLAFDWRRLWEPLILWLWSLSWVHAFYHGRQLLVGAIWRDFLEAEQVNLKRIDYFGFESFRSSLSVNGTLPRNINGSTTTPI